MPKTDFSHQLAIDDASGTEVGLTLIEERNGLAYSETVDSAAAQQFFTGDVDYARLPPDKEIVLTGGDFRGGFGLEYAGQSTTRYHVGTSIDARFKEETRLGALPSTITTIDGVAAAASITNSNCETESSGWTNGARDDAQAHAGTYSWYSSANEEIYQDAATWATDWQNETFIFGMWVYATAGATDARIGINDNVGTTYSSYHTGGGSWEYLEVKRTLDGSATRFRLILDHNSSTYAWFDDAVAYSPVYGAYAAWAEFNGLHYISKGRMLLKQNSGGTAYTFVRSFEVAITDLCVATISGVDYLFICIGLSNNYWYATTGESFTRSTVGAMKFMQVVGTQVYGSNTNSTVLSTVDPLNGGTAWGNSKQIGEDTYDVIDLQNFEGILYIRKNDCTVYKMSSNTPASQAVTTLISGKANIAGTNTARMFVWRNSAILFPYGLQGLIHYDGTTLTHINPVLYMNNASNFSGQIQAIAGDDQKLYVVLDNSAKVEVLSVHQENVDGTTDWRWHPQASITLTNCTSATISSHVKQRLWIGSDTGTESLYYVPITVKYGDIANDSDITYQTGGSIETPFYHFNLMGDNKAFLKLTLRMSGTTANIYWKAYYWKLGDSSWTGISTSSHFKTSPSTSGFIFSAVGTAVISTMMKFKFEGITNSSATSPVLIGFDVRAIWYPAERKIINCMVRAEDNQPTVNIGKDEVLGSTIRSTLDGINDNNWPRAFYPPYWLTSADTIYVKKLPLPEGAPQLELLKLEKDSEPIWVYRLRLEVVEMS